MFLKYWEMTVLLHITVLILYNIMTIELHIHDTFVLLFSKVSITLPVLPLLWMTQPCRGRLQSHPCHDIFAILIFSLEFNHQNTNLLVITYFSLKHYIKQLEM